MDHVKNEITILNSVDHPFIVQMNGLAQDSRYIYICLEYVQGGELFTHLRRQKRFGKVQTSFFAAHTFEIAPHPVSKGEYLEFLVDGGYSDFRFWHAAGWDWVKKNQIKAPLYWHWIDGQWMEYGFKGLLDIVPHEAVCHINYFEAAAFAAWKGKRLPTEMEWEVASNQLKWGHRWEWTESAYLPYPKFEKAKGAIGEYNGKFMVDQMVLRGASVATPKGHSRKTYRNFFQTDRRWQFSGLRLAH